MRGAPQSAPLSIYFIDGQLFKTIDIGFHLRDLGVGRVEEGDLVARTDQVMVRILDLVETPTLKVLCSTN